MDPAAINEWSKIANTIGVTAVLLWAIVLFYRGDILSRRVYTDLTEHIILGLTEKLAERVAGKVVKELEEQLT